MKKSIYVFGFMLLSVATAFSQAVLPTSWSFTTATLPTGWTESGTAFYTGSGNTPPACKFDNSGDYLTIFFASNPGSVTYYLTGNSFSGGTFLVEESVNGSTWTTLHSHTTPPNGTYTQFTDVPNSASRYIRFNYSVKVSGNIGLDDVNIAAGAATPAQEINVKENAVTVVSGGTVVANSPVLTTTPINFSIENLGTVNTLTISAVNITGADAADFSVNSSPASVSALGTGTLVIDFTPAVAGTRNATITIVSDDADEASYVINIIGIGGSFATEPTAQATGMSITSIKSYRMNVSFTAASPAPEGYLVLRKKGSPITDVPVDGTVYDRGDNIGASQVAYCNDGTSFVPNNIVASSDYYYAVFSYNGPGQYRNYLTTAPLTGNATSLGSMQGATYYNGVSTANASFVTDLSAKINPHNMQFYGSYGSIMVTNFAARDTVDDQRVITCVYSGENKIYSEPFDWTANNFSREHSYCHQWMPTYPGTTGPEYQDYHQLFPTDQNNANAIRSNYPLGVVVNASYTFLGCKLGTNASGETVFEPRDAQKGDAARALMYQAVCYNGISGNSWAFPDPISGTITYGQDQNVLKMWHYQDAPDAFEIARNDYIDSVQGNRNPFIDSVHFACYIDFTNMSKITSPSLPCNSVGVNENTNLNDYITVSPNPNNGDFILNYLTEKNQNVTINLYDMVGKLVMTRVVSLTSGINQIEMHISDFQKGIYIFEFTTEKGKTTEKLIIE